MAKKNKFKAKSTSNELEKIAIEQAKAKKKFITYTKGILTFVIINSELQIWASYLLAYLGKDAIAESLSEQVVIIVIGSLIPYFAKSLIENLSKKTTLFGKNLPYENAYEENMNMDTIIEDFEAEVEEVKSASEIDLNSIDEECEEV